MSIEVKISKKRIPYKTAMLYLDKRVEEVKSDKNRELLWILEHPTTYTAGVSFNKKEIIDKKSEAFSVIDVDIEKIDWLYLKREGHRRANIFVKESTKDTWVSP